LSKTQHTLPDQAGPGVKDERWIDLWFQEALAWRALRLPAKFPNSNFPKPRVPETPSYWLGRASIWPVLAFKRRCPGEAQWQDITGSHVPIAVRSSLGSAGASRMSSIRV